MKKILKRILPIALIVALLVAPFVPAQPVFAQGEWLEGYQWRAQVPVTGQAGSGTRYQLMLEVRSGIGDNAAGVVYLNNKSQDFPNDIRFTDNDQITLLPYWLEPGSGTTRHFWIRITDDLGSNQTFYIYYGNATPQAFNIPPLGFWDKWLKSENYYAPDNPGLVENMVWDSVLGGYYIPVAKSDEIKVLSSPGAGATTWTDEGVILSMGEADEWDDVAVTAPHLFKEGDTWYLYYNGYGEPSPDYEGGIGYATSSSVLGPYTRSDSNPVLNYVVATWESKRVAEIYVYEDSGTWYMSYMGDDGVDEQIGYATANSVEGPWTKHDDNPVVPLGAAGEWDEGATADSFNYVFTNNAGDKQRYVFYTGTRQRAASPDQRASIGYAEINPSYTTFTKRGPMLFYNPGGWDDMIIRGAITKLGGWYYLPYNSSDGSWHWGVAYMYGKSSDSGFPPQQVFNTFDDFSVNLSQWRVYPDDDEGEWSIVSEHLQHSAAGTTHIFIPGEAYSSYTYEIQAQQIGGWFGFLFGVKDHPNDNITANAIIVKDGNYWIGWFDNSSSSTQIQGYTPIELDVDIEHNYKIIAEAGKYRFYIDDVLIYTNNAPPTNPTIGGVGIWKGGGTTKVDDITVRKYHDAEPTIGTAYAAEEKGPPVVTTSDVVNKTESSATLQGTLTDLGEYSPVYVSFQYGLTDSYGTNTADQTKTVTGGFSADISGLIAGTIYYYKARVRYDSSYVYGAPKSFTATSAGEPGIDPPDILRIDDVKVFSNYLPDDPGNQLYVIAYRIIYNSGTPILDVSDYFDFQLLDGTTLKAQIPVKSWDYKPGSIYLCSDSTPTWGGSYRIKIIGTPEKWETPPECYRDLTPGDWQGTDLTQLDTWCISLATSLQSFYDAVLVTHTTGGQAVLSRQGGVIFNMGIPNLSTVRPNLFSASAEYLSPEEQEHGTEGQEALNPEEHMGGYVFGLFETGADFFNMETTTFGGLVFGVGYIITAIAIGAMIGSGLVGMGIAAPVIIVGAWFGLIPLALIMIVAGIFVMYTLFTIWIRGV